MKYKKIMLITLLLLAVLTLGSVNAADNLTDDILQGDLSDNIEVDDVISSVQDDVIGNDEGTFTALKNKIQGAGDNATINLENDYFYDGTGTISISNAITINGNGHKIDGNSQSSVFILSAKVTLENITFIHCSDKYGGAISIDSSASNCNVISCNFIDCTGVSAYGTYPSPNDGGAILNLGKNTNIVSCTFVNCTTYNGGAILSSASNCKITSCDFRNCHVANQGGAIFSDNECIISSCKFINCVSDNKGGAIFNAGETNINSCNFTNCSAYTGNAIHNQRGNTKVKNSNFVDLAKSEVSTRESGSVEFTDCTFNDPVPEYKYELWVSDESIIFKQNNPDYYPANVAYMAVPPTISEGKFQISDGDKELFSSPITDTYHWDTYSSQKLCSIFIEDLNFNGVNNDDIVRFVFLDGNDNEVIAKEYSICFNGDVVKFELYNESSEKIDPKLTIDVDDVDYGNDVLVVITTNETFSGDVSVQIENGIYPVTVTNGYGNNTIPNLNSGNHTANAIFKATRLFKGSNVETNFTVNKIDSSINIGDVEMDYGTSKNVEVTTVGATGFTAKIDGADAVVEDNKVVVSGLSIGNHTLSVTTNPDLNHNPVTKNVTVTVKEIVNPPVEKANSSVSVDPITFDYGGSGSADVVLVNATGFTASIANYPDAVSIDGNKITVSGLAAGTYILTVTTVVDGNHIAVTRNVTVTVKEIVNPPVEKANSTISVNDVVMDYGTSKKVVVGTVGANGFIAKIDGNDAVVDGNSVVVSGLIPGIHTLTVTTIPDADHNEVTKNATITVNKLKVIITGVALTTTYGTSKNIQVTLKDSKGNPLKAVKFTMVLNKVTYANRITDANGVGKFCTAPKTLAPNTYTAKFTFAGNDIYSASTGSVKVVVKKVTPKITAKAKSFKKSDKTKKYSVTLNVKQKVKVAIKVNKKTYYAYTTANGVATFKLNKLTKKGKYTATVSFAGNAYYNKAKSVSVKITVK